jgi:hypothetical protein
MPRQIMVGLSPIAAAARSIREYGQREKAEALAAELRRIAEEERQFENSLATRKQDETERAARTGEGFEGTRVGYEGERVGIAKGDYGMRQAAFGNQQADRAELGELTRTEADPTRRRVLDLKRLGVDTDEAFFQTPEERGAAQGAQASAAWQGGGRNVFADQSGIQTAGQMRVIGARQAATGTGGDDVAAIADEVVKNPELLGQVNPTMRGKVIAHINKSGGELSNRRAASLTSILDDAERTIGQMSSHPGFSGAVGAKGPSSLFGILEQPMSGTNAAGFAKLVETLKAQLALPKLEYMRGLGPMSDREFRSIQAAVSALDPTMPEAQFRQELKNVLDGITRTRTNLSSQGMGGAPVQVGGGAGAPNDPLGIRKR